MIMNNIFKSVIIAFFITVGTTFAVSQDQLSQYVYEDTKQLVSLVEDAASQIEIKGENAFKDFSVKDSRWLNDKYYLFAYDITGKCVFHPIEPSLVGKDLSGFRDIENRLVVKMITDVGRDDRRDNNGWVFYLWEEPWHSFPKWKSSYIRKAVAPDKKVYLIGCGLYDMKTEKTFISQQVDKAADLMIRDGIQSVTKILKDRSCDLHFMDSYISVADSKGILVVDPSFPSVNVRRNLLDMVDKTGINVGEEIKNALMTKDRVWISYIWPKADANSLARKLVYVRKVRSENVDYYISMDFYPATPIWMK